jgi:hypothetical protein
MSPVFLSRGELSIPRTVADGAAYRLQLVEEWSG